MSTYTARAERDEGGWWAVSVAELPGVFTQARRLDQVEELVRDAIALWLETPTRSVDVSVEASVPDLDREIEEVALARRRAEELREEASARSRQLASELARRGFTVRDIGQVLGVSHQRAAQLLDKKAVGKPVKRRVPPSRANATASAGRSSEKKVVKAAGKKKRASV
jgi:predicted RNase H-like HicB family nuclease